MSPLNLAQVKEELKAKVLRGKFSCKFSLVSENTKVILEESSVSCSPAKPKKQKVSGLEIEGRLGTYTLSFNINPSKITRATLSAPATTPGK